MQDMRNYTQDIIDKPLYLKIECPSKSLHLKGHCARSGSPAYAPINTKHSAVDMNTANAQTACLAVALLKGTPLRLSDERLICIQSKIG